VVRSLQGLAEQVTGERLLNDKVDALAGGPAYSTGPYHSKDNMRRSE
jgi:hypothetical protein